MLLLAPSGMFPPATVTQSHTHFFLFAYFIYYLGYWKFQAFLSNLV